MQNEFSSPLNHVKVASPCSQDWDAMVGNETKRYCGECKLNVYNLSGMSRAEAERLILNSEGRLCVRFYRRADGSILTQDCPVGWRAVKVRMTKMATAFASLIFGLLGGLGLNSYMKEQQNVTVGAMRPMNTNSKFETGKREVLMGDVAMPPKNVAIAGGISVEEVKKNMKTEKQNESGKVTISPSDRNESKNSPQK